MSRVARACVVGALVVAVGCDAGRTSANDTGASAGGSTGGTATTDATGDPPPTAPGGYYVLGNKIYDEAGNVHRFYGVARPSLEWNPNGENLSAADYQNMAGWNANVVRIALNQGFWLPGSQVHAPQYQANVDQNIQWALDAGMDVILDLHWSDRGDFSVEPGQQRVVFPPTMRQTWSRETVGADDPYREFLCPVADEACRAGTVGWVQRFEDAQRRSRRGSASTCHSRRSRR